MPKYFSDEIFALFIKKPSDKLETIKGLVNIAYELTIWLFAIVIMRSFQHLMYRMAEESGSGGHVSELVCSHILSKVCDFGRRMPCNWKAATVNILPCRLRWTWINVMWGRVKRLSLKKIFHPICYGRWGYSPLYGGYQGMGQGVGKA